MKRYPVSLATLQTYTTSGLIMIAFGVIGILIGLFFLVSVGTTVGRYRASGTYNSRALLLGLAFVGGGGALAFGARTPLSRAAKARGSYVEVADSYVEWLDPEGGKRRLEFAEVVDVYETDTSITLGAKGSGKSLTIPNEYDDYEEMTRTLKRASGRG